MIPFYAADPIAFANVCTVRGTGLVGSRTWDDFESQAAAADIAVVAIEGRDIPAQFAQVAWLTSRHAARIVLVLGDNVHHDSLLAASGASSVLRMAHLERRLPLGIENARAVAWRQLEPPSVVWLVMKPTIVPAWQPGASCVSLPVLR